MKQKEPAAFASGWLFFFDGLEISTYLCTEKILSIY